MKEKLKRFQDSVFFYPLIIGFMFLIYFIGFYSGYSAGAYQMLDWGVSKAIWFAQINNVSIGLDRGLILDGVMRYKGNIGGCWNIEQNKTGVINAPLYSN